MRNLVSKRDRVGGTSSALSLSYGGIVLKKEEYRPISRLRISEPLKVQALAGMCLNHSLHSKSWSTARFSIN